MNNTVILSGKITNVTPAFLAKSGKVITRCEITTTRLSSTDDIISLVIPDSVVPHSALVQIGNCENNCIRVVGHIRTTDYFENDKRRLRQYVYVETFEEQDPDEPVCENEVKLTGIVVRPIEYRHTPLGRIIADIFLAHNPTGKHTSYYIPCVAWGQLAIALTNYKVGDKITVYGRYQSRWYKKLVGDKVEEKLVNEVSINKFEEEK